MLLVDPEVWSGLLAQQMIFIGLQWGICGQLGDSADKINNRGLKRLLQSQGQSKVMNTLRENEMICIFQRF